MTKIFVCAAKDCRFQHDPCILKEINLDENGRCSWYEPVPVCADPACRLPLVDWRANIVEEESTEDRIAVKCRRCETITYVDRAKYEAKQEG